jgi:hypothetical protein
MILVLPEVRGSGPVSYWSLAPAVAQTHVLRDLVACFVELHDWATAAALLEETEIENSSWKWCT